MRKLHVAHGAHGATHACLQVACTTTWESVQRGMRASEADGQPSLCHCHAGIRCWLGASACGLRLPWLPATWCVHAAPCSLCHTLMHTCTTSLSSSLRVPQGVLLFVFAPCGLWAPEPDSLPLPSLHCPGWRRYESCHPHSLCHGGGCEAVAFTHFSGHTFSGHFFKLIWIPQQVFL